MNGKSWLMTGIALVSFGGLAAPVETELRKLLADYDGFSANFAQQVMDTEKNLLMKAEGELVFKQPGKFRWQTFEPHQQLLLSNGESLWWYNPDLEEVSIFDAKQAVATTPFALLVSNRDETWNKFVIDKVGSGYVIKPKEADHSQVQKLEIRFDGFTLSEMTITDRTQQTTSYTLSNQNFDKAKTRHFNFSIPEDVEVDDQRESANN